MNNNIKGIIGSVLVLSLFGGTIFLSQDQINSTWYCDANNKTAIFDRLSSTNKTGYWTIDGVEKSSSCTNSKWVPLRDYCKSHNISCDLPIVQPPIDSVSDSNNLPGEKWLCDQHTCTKV
jgi:hypothetical protein